MIEIDKYTDLDTSVLWIAHFVLDALMNDLNIRYSELIHRIVVKKWDVSKVNIPFALTFLYSLWIIIYEPEIDNISLLQRDI